MYGELSRSEHVVVPSDGTARPPPSTAGSLTLSVDATTTLSIDVIAQDTLLNVPELSSPVHDVCTAPQYAVMMDDAPAPVPPVMVEELAAKRIVVRPPDSKVPDSGMLHTVSPWLLTVLPHRRTTKHNSAQRAIAKMLVAKRSHSPQ
eukprot:1962353-Rhodomonas_salina.2